MPARYLTRPQRFRASFSEGDYIQSRSVDYGVWTLYSRGRWPGKNSLAGGQLVRGEGLIGMVDVQTAGPPLAVATHFPMG